MPLNNVRRPDLVATYNHVPAPKGLYSSSASQGVLSQSMPMAAMFMKNKFLAWFAVLTTWHAFLTSHPDPANPTDSPLMKIGMAVVAVGMNYMGLFLPGVQAPAAIASKAASTAAAVAADTATA
ncbi:unnamed protein product [Kluyveromyces dobzhanskii CBS 2104]|uniref:WGS project CCBQ000000000 data, contig 00041 n=1 Tax=Kluyveromyces dobzhanskii CBS 2104 TaxID=1427455 RepID=A0A0A8L2E4_9SACH|nr:unnamed protein product [Kluyveromyces dobzhanskii CBS 2104]